MKSVLVLIVTVVALALVCQAAEELKVIPTPTGVDFFGKAYVNGTPVKIGDVITAYDPQGILCGKFVVKKPGLFGYLCVYGDDPTTDVDEGALPGDTISFKINGKPARVDCPEKAIWTKNNDRFEINLFVTE